MKIGGCLDIDGDSDAVSYNFTWPGSISNPTADRLLNAQSLLFTSPTTRGKDFTSMAFESDISRDESDDTSFHDDTPCQRHPLNPSDPSPGTVCVNPPPNSVFYPFYSTRTVAGTCMWQEGGPYIPGTQTPSPRSWPAQDLSSERSSTARRTLAQRLLRIVQ